MKNEVLKTFKALGFIILCLIFFKQGAYGQSEIIHQLSGVVVDDSSKAIPFVHILVKNKRRGTISDFEGYFSLVVVRGDTLTFSAIGYKKEQYIVPDNIEKSDINIVKKMQTDTIMLAETIIFPWNSYEQFKEAFLNLDVPHDDIDRALKNLASIENQLQQYMADPDPGLNYKYFMQQTYNQLYYAGQLPPNNLLNPVAWAKFFKALKNGEFKRKTYQYTE